MSALHRVSISLIATEGSTPDPGPRCRRDRSSRWGPIAVTFAIASVVAVLAPAVPAHAAGVTCHGVRATIVGTSLADVIHGTAGRDVVAGLGGNDTIVTGGGNDLVCAGEGADHLDGGAGSDRLYGELDFLLDLNDEDGFERTGDTLDGGPGDDRLFAGTDPRSADFVVLDGFTWEGSAHGVRIDLRTGTARGEGTDTFAGGKFTVLASAHSDVVEGTARRDRIDTGAGPDVVRARGGADIVDMDRGPGAFGGDADRVWGGDGDDVLTSRRGQDQVSGGAGHDLIQAFGTGNDVLEGGDGNDAFFAQIGDTGGPQSIVGGHGSDGLQLDTDVINPSGADSSGTWQMSTGNLTYTLDHQISMTVHIEGAVFVSPGTQWTITGTPGDDVVSGDSNITSSPLTFHGLAGDDLFSGTDGDDVFDGGLGQDRSFGMFGGDDTCISVETLDSADCEHVS